MDKPEPAEENCSQAQAAAKINAACFLVERIAERRVAAPHERRGVAQAKEARRCVFCRAWLGLMLIRSHDVGPSSAPALKCVGGYWARQFGQLPSAKPVQAAWRRLTTPSF